MLKTNDTPEPDESKSAERGSAGKRGPKTAGKRRRPIEAEFLQRRRRYVREWGFAAAWLDLIEDPRDKRIASKLLHALGSAAFRGGLTDDERERFEQALPKAQNQRKRNKALADALNSGNPLQLLFAVKAFNKDADPSLSTDDLLWKAAEAVFEAKRKPGRPRKDQQGEPNVFERLADLSKKMGFDSPTAEAFKKALSRVQK